MLEPVFNDAAEEVKKIFTEPGRIIFGKVDCDQESMMKLLLKSCEQE